VVFEPEGGEKTEQEGIRWDGNLTIVVAFDTTIQRDFLKKILKKGAENKYLKIFSGFINFGVKF